MSIPTSVYRYLDEDGVLIYVGVTNRGVLRQGEHNNRASWWRFVRSQEVEHYDDRDTALRRERYLIGKHQPPFNVQHNTAHRHRLAAYLEHAAVAPLEEIEDEGEESAWHEGFAHGETYAWRCAAEQYAPQHLADVTLRTVIDGWPSRTGGDVTLGLWEAEASRRNLETEIALVGVSALVDEVASRDLWLTSKEPPT